jgi:hypothetical protein
VAVEATAATTDPAVIRRARQTHRERPRRPGVVVCATLGLFLAGACSSGGGARPAQPAAGTTVVATDAATTALRGAVTAMRQESSFRFSGRISQASGATQVVGEFQAPDRVHLVVTASQGTTAEYISIGSTVYVKNASTGKWVNRFQSPASANTSDPRVTFDAVAQAQQVTASGDGYDFTLPAPAVALLVTGLGSGVAVSGHLKPTPGGIGHLDLRITSPKAQLQETDDYQNLGSGPAVVQPPVG